ncbi:MAG: hypothetical protein ABFD77_11105 [Thermotogota bacterium]
MEVLIPNAHRATSSPFADMMLSERQLLRAFLLFERVLKASFAEDEKTMGEHFRRKVQTGAEMKRRAGIMARWFRVFRGDLGYSLARIEAELGRALRCELNGGLYTPTSASRSYGVPEGEAQ